MASEYDDIPMDDEESEGESPDSGKSDSDLGLSLKRALAGGNGEAICELIRQIAGM